MNILVTGAGGMIGSHLVELLFLSGNYVVGTFYKPTIDITEIPKDITMIECDVRYASNVEKIIFKYEPEQIYHLAAQSYPTVSWDKPYETIETNINGTIAIFESVKKVRKYFKPSYNPIIVVACSSAEYGAAFNMLKEDKVFVEETAELKPLHPYGISKVGQDLLSFQYYLNDHIRCIRARIFNSTGTRKVNDVISDFTYRAIEAEKNGIYKLRVGNLNTRRAILDQRDLIKALILLADKGKAGEAYNISSKYIYQMKELVSIIEKQIGHTLEIIVDPKLFRSTDEPIIAGDISKLVADTCWEQEIPIEQTISDMLNYWRLHI